MKYAIGADHRGYVYKQYIIEHFKHHPKTHADIMWLDVGAYTDQRSDYPTYAIAVCNALRAGTAQEGILLCGNGIGMSIAVNRFRGMYGALAWNKDVVAMAREHDNANILILPADFITQKAVHDMIYTWITTARTLTGRHKERIEMIDKLD